MSKYVCPSSERTVVRTSVAKDSLQFSSSVFHFKRIPLVSLLELNTFLLYTKKALYSHPNVSVGE